MAIKVARGQITIIDQNDAVSLQAFELMISYS